jgi:hypothetical protein
MRVAHWLTKNKRAVRVESSMYVVDWHHTTTCATPGGAAIPRNTKNALRGITHAPQWGLAVSLQAGSWCERWPHRDNRRPCRMLWRQPSHPHICLRGHAEWLGWHIALSSTLHGDVMCVFRLLQKPAEPACRVRTEQRIVSMCSGAKPSPTCL